MAKFQSPMLGYNNNVRHRGRVFHIQTEDSGAGHPHIITHLFMDGGRILKSVKTSYAEHVGSDGMSETVRVMMKEQHKGMLIALRDGQFDELFDGGKGAARAKEKEKEGVKAAAPSAPALVPPAEPSSPATTPEPPRLDEPTLESAEAVPHEPFAVAADAETIERVAPVAPPKEPERRRASAQELTLDFDALERDDTISSPLFHRSSLPPPPDNVLPASRRLDAGSGGYRRMEVAPRDEVVLPPGRVSQPPPSPARPNAARVQQRPPVQSTGSGAASERRYAPARPAAIFGAPPKPSNLGSMFGDDLVSDKSLDEVILSYLAEDLEPPQRNK